MLSKTNDYSQLIDVYFQCINKKKKALGRIDRSRIYTGISIKTVNDKYINQANVCRHREIHERNINTHLADTEKYMKRGGGGERLAKCWWSFYNSCYPVSVEILHGVKHRSTSGDLASTEFSHTNR